MSISIQIDHERRRVVGVAEGTLEDRDLFAYQLEAGRFPDYDEVFDGTAVDAYGNPRAGFEAKTEISRKDFGLTWNVALEAGGVLVSDKVKISLDISAIKA